MLSPDFWLFLSARGRFLPPHAPEMRCGKFKVSRRVMAHLGAEELGAALDSPLSSSACRATAMVSLWLFRQQGA